MCSLRITLSNIKGLVVITFLDVIQALQFELECSLLLLHGTRVTVSRGSSAPSKIVEGGKKQNKSYQSLKN